MNNTWLVGVIALVVGVLIGWSFGASNSSRIQGVNSQTAEGAKASELRLGMRKLWTEHIVWTRAWIVSDVYNTGAADADAARLLKNQEDIGNAIKPYYGDEAGDKLTTLLKEHIGAAVDLVKASKENNTEAITVADTALSANVEEIAELLASANPNLPKDDLNSMLKMHLDLLKQQATDIMQGNHEASVTDSDKSVEEIEKMADALSDGIIKQFPEKF